MATRTVETGAKVKRGKEIPDVDPDEAFAMDKPNMGHALIMNNVQNELKGSKVDVEALKSAFEIVGFNVRVETNCSKQMMAELKRWIMDNKTHEESNCFILVVICHGDENGYLLDKNKSKAWRVDDVLLDLSVVRSLAGKPKIMICQACKGTEWTSAKEPPRGALSTRSVETQSIVPPGSDIFVADATVPGFIAYGGDETGSDYLQAFSQYLVRHYMERDFGTICHMVNKYLRSVEQGPERLLQVPQYTTSSSCKLHFSEFHKKKPQVSAATVSTKAVNVAAAVITPKSKAMTMASLQTVAPITEARPIKDENSEETSLGGSVSDRIKLFQQSSSKVSSTPAKALPVSRPALQPQPKPLFTPQPKTAQRELKLELIATHDTRLPAFGKLRSTVLPTKGDFVIWGKASDTSPSSFHLYSMTPQLTKKDGFKAVCEHEDSVNVFAVKVNYKELLAVSCLDCDKIRLLDLEKQTVTVGFHNPSYYPTSMCAGEGDVLYVAHSVKGDKEVLELNTAQSPFTGPNKVIASGMDNYYGIHFVPSPYKLIVVSDHSKSLIKAVGVDSSEPRWEVRGRVDGLECRPHGLLFSPRHQVLLVADGRNSRVLVLHPGDGSHLQTFQLHQLGVVANLAFFQNKLIVQHNVDQKEKVSYFSINL